ncbi:Translation machinery-associated protein 46 [Marasmius tenuissimus]|uniref:Translation machinery-associated protein 46 n=1 Tax=Marasmius tenuissimus TaxID=585030 RepID=A0ABR3A286_9AGAR
MPPKKQQQASSSKVKDDKTFGMKNKNKSAKVQKEVQRIQQQQQNAGKSRAALEKEKEKDLRAKEKADEEKRKKEEAALLKPVISQKVPFGVDPKTVLCAYFKAGHCEKGSKCKFSHDLDVGRKVEKKNLYADAREEKMADTMDQWDEEKLRSVVLSKHGNPRTTTDIVCKYFIEAIESQKYDESAISPPSSADDFASRFGWFWECPNGGEKCQYRHALPPGFVLKSQRKAAEEAAKGQTISLEEFLEVERHKLGSNLTPVTPETFAKWKQTRMDKKQAEEEALRKAKDVQNAAGKNSGMSGRDLFQYNPEWFEDEDDDGEDEWDLAKYRREQEEEDLAAEEQRIADLKLQDGGYHEDGA